jgi:hypothetical protein
MYGGIGVLDDGLEVGVLIENRVMMMMMKERRPTNSEVMKYIPTIHTGSNMSTPAHLGGESPPAPLVPPNTGSCSTGVRTPSLPTLSITAPER